MIDIAAQGGPLRPSHRRKLCGPARLVKYRFLTPFPLKKQQAVDTIGVRLPTPDLRLPPHQSPVRWLAFKWIRILFRCWKNRQPYDEARYLQQLRSNGVSYLSNLKPT
jgi:hypothetical protein